MAERQFVIVIRNESGGNGVGNQVGGAGGISGQQQREEGSKKKDWTDVIGARFKKFATVGGTFAFVKSTVDTIVTHNNSLIEIQTGSNEAQARASFIYNNASSFVSSVAGGFISGMAITGGNPVGGAVGAVIGAVSDVFGKLINYSLETDKISKQRRVEEYQNFLATSQRVTVTGSRYMSAAHGG